jgi:hypothetical protein
MELVIGSNKEKRRAYLIRRYKEIFRKIRKITCDSSPSSCSITTEKDSTNHA